MLKSNLPIAILLLSSGRTRMNFSLLDETSLINDGKIMFLALINGLLIVIF
jgi:hypothetical protein